VVGVPHPRRPMSPWHVLLAVLPQTAVMSEADRHTSRFVLPAGRPALRGDDDLAGKTTFGRLVRGRGGGQRKLAHRQAGEVTCG